MPKFFEINIEPIDWEDKKQEQEGLITAHRENLGQPTLLTNGARTNPYGAIAKYFSANNLGGDTENDEDSSNKTYHWQDYLSFFYHSDHLGSSSNITDITGEVYQHVEYFPFGETFVDERPGTYGLDFGYNLGTPYLYNGKELDEETGLYYYGARYYDPRISMWYGVDPKAENSPMWSPYCYTFDNPLNMVDPDGQWPIKPLKKIPRGVGSPAAEFVHNSFVEFANGIIGTINWATSTDPNAPTLTDLAVQAFDAIEDFDIKDLRDPEVKEQIGGMAIGAAVGAGANKLVKGSKTGSTVSEASTPKALPEGPNLKALPEGSTTVDPNTGVRVGRFAVDSRGNTMIEPQGGSTRPAGRGGVDTHTTYPNGSNYQRLNPLGHGRNTTGHGHGHLQGTGSGMRGQGQSIDVYGNPVNWNSAPAHWPIK